MNALLGLDILPVGKPPATNTLVEMVDAQDGDWTLEILYQEGYQEIQRYNSAVELKQPLAFYSARDNGPSPKETPRKVRVRGPFHQTSRVFNGAMLMDTPGAEAAFEDGDAKEADDNPIRAETRCAVEALEEAHVILFCARADNMGAKNVSQFYNREMKMLAPLNLVNFLDKWEDAEETPCIQAYKFYGFPPDRTMALSARYAYEAGLDPRERKPEIWEKSRMAELEDRIILELQRLEPEKAYEETMEALRRLRENHPRIPMKPKPLFLNALDEKARMVGADVSPAAILRR